MSIRQMLWSDMPLKFWESLTAGKPLVTTIEETLISNIHGLISTARNTYEFVNAIDFVINNDMSKKIQMGIELASENTWPLRVEEMERIIDEHRIGKIGIDA